MPNRTAPKPVTLVRYIDKILNKLLVLLQNDNQMLRTEAMFALSAIAFVSKEHFQKYYEIVMPYLKTILLNENDKSKHTLLRYTLECISVLAMIVDKGNFEDDSKQVMEVLKSALESEVKELDTIAYSLQIIPTWLNCLPIKGDWTEAKLVHDKLCSMVERSDREVLGLHYEHLSKIMSIFAEVLCAREDLATKDTANA